MAKRGLAHESPGCSAVFFIHSLIYSFTRRISIMVIVCYSNDKFWHTAGVPTMLQGLTQHLARNKYLVDGTVSREANQVLGMGIWGEKAEPQIRRSKFWPQHSSTQSLFCSALLFPSVKWGNRLAKLQGPFWIKIPGCQDWLWLLRWSWETAVPKSSPTPGRPLARCMSYLLCCNKLAYISAT